MENKIYRFDELFIIDEITKAKQLLREGNIDFATKEQIILMIKKFYEYLNVTYYKKKKTKVVKKDNKDELYKKLENKLKSDLEKIDIDFWRSIKYLYNNINHLTFEEKNYENLTISDTNMLNIILGFYKNIDSEYYKLASQIINSPIPLINFDESSKIGNELFPCLFLKLPFINIKSSCDEKYIVFVHELQHAIDYLLNDFKVFGLFRELAPIFFEIIFVDILDSINPSEGLYSIRINNHICMMEWLNSYVDTLLLFDKLGRKVTKYNINTILGTDDKKCFENKIKSLIKKDFVEYYRYTLSLFRALELREEYYRGDKKQTIQKLKDNMSGKNTNIKFYNCVRCYNNFIEEIKEKNYIYQKTVK